MAPTINPDNDPNRDKPVQNRPRNIPDRFTHNVNYNDFSGYCYNHSSYYCGCPAEHVVYDFGTGRTTVSDHYRPSRTIRYNDVVYHDTDDSNDPPYAGANRYHEYNRTDDNHDDNAAKFDDLSNVTIGDVYYGYTDDIAND